MLEAHQSRQWVAVLLPAAPRLRPQRCSHRPRPAPTLCTAPGWDTRPCTALTSSRSSTRPPSRASTRTARRRWVTVGARVRESTAGDAHRHTACPCPPPSRSCACCVAQHDTLTMVRASLARTGARAVLAELLEAADGDTACVRVVVMPTRHPLGPRLPLTRHRCTHATSCSCSAPRSRAGLVQGGA